MGFMRVCGEEEESGVGWSGMVVEGSKEKDGTTSDGTGAIVSKGVWGWGLGRMHRDVEAQESRRFPLGL